ncbi:Imm10 family immunity protein [Stenotrophomonas maltophilia]|nr:Imm10 family immunity protein [Stenotrophomonas maltophilia]
MKRTQAIYTFNANVVFIEDDSHCLIVGLADDADDPSHYLILQSSRDFDEQDIRLGMDRIHLEIGGALQPCYGGLERVALREVSLELLISGEARKKLGIDGAIEVVLTDVSCRARLDVALAQMCAANGVPFVAERK